MKKITILSVVVASLLLVGCGNQAKDKAVETAPAVEKSAVEKATDAVKDTTAKVAEKTAEVAKEAGKVAEKAKDAVVEKAKEVKKVVKDKVAEAKGAVDTKACAGCHGANFEKKAMNVSKIVKDMSKDDIVKALKGYKDGSYGGKMKALMKGQVASFDDAKIEAVASQIAK
jgi:cytochrome c553